MPKSAIAILPACNAVTATGLRRETNRAHALAVAGLGGVTITRRIERHELAYHCLIRPVTFHFEGSTKVVEINA